MFLEISPSVSHLFYAFLILNKKDEKNAEDIGSKKYLQDYIDNLSILLFTYFDVRDWVTQISQIILKTVNDNQTYSYD